jgi:hypothetical protein
VILCVEIGDFRKFWIVDGEMEVRRPQIIAK